MTFYWYQNDFTKLPDWTKVFASKIITGKQNYFQAKLNIIDNSHQIDLKTSPSLGFTEILASNLPIELLPKAIEFELTQDLEIKTQNSTLKTTKYNTKDVDKFLDQEDCLFYNFENDDWTILKWKIDDSVVIFETLHTYPKLELSLWSQSQYSY